ncbi:hypothetical protein Hanom_Chr10g00873491 [Helianthus anomalus]
MKTCVSFVSHLKIVFLASFFWTARNDVPTTVTPGVVAKVDYSTAASPLALPDARKPNSTRPKAQHTTRKLGNCHQNLPPKITITKLVTFFQPKSFW